MYIFQASRHDYAHEHLAVCSVCPTLIRICIYWFNKMESCQQSLSKLYYDQSIKKKSYEYVLAVYIYEDGDIWSRSSSSWTRGTLKKSFRFTGSSSPSWLTKPYDRWATYYFRCNYRFCWLYIYLFFHPTFLFFEGYDPSSVLFPTGLSISDE